MAYESIIMRTALCLTLGVCLGGCLGEPGPSGSTEADDIDVTRATEAAMDTVGLIPQTRPPIADLPVPVNFKIVDALSSDQKTDSGRTVDHVYQGRDDKFDVERFYVIQMPIKDWVQTNRRYQGGKFNLEFEKADEKCAIEIITRPGVPFQRTTISIKVHRMPQYPADPPQPEK